MAGAVDEALLKDFVLDSHEHLNAVEPDLLAMESGGCVSPEAIHRILRAVHSIKGFSTFLGFDPLTDLGHAMENILTLMRDGRLAPHTEVVDALLAGIDRLQVMLRDIQAGETIAPCPETSRLESLLAEVELSPTGSHQCTLDGSPVLEAPSGRVTLRVDGGEALGAAEFTVERSEVARAEADGRSLFALWIDPEHDLSARGVSPESFRANLESIGQVLAADQATDQAGWRHWLLASLISDPELLAAAVEVPPQRIHPVAYSGQPTPAAEPPAVAEPPAPRRGAVKLRVAGRGELDTLELVVERRQVELAVQGIHCLYAVWVHRERDLAAAGRSLDQLQQAVASVGRVLAVDPDGPGPWRHLLAASKIREPDTVSLAYELPGAQVVQLPSQVLRQALGTAAPAQAAEPAQPEAPAETKTPSKTAEPEAPAGQPSPPAITAAPETIRVGVPLVDRLINLAGELVLSRNQLKLLMAGGDGGQGAVERVIQTVDLVTSELQEHIMQLRMQPVGRLFNRFPRLVRDLARRLNKEVELEIHGGEVELDKSILEQLTDPLTHLVRNSVDHGLESPQQRRALGKPPAGRMVLRAFHQEGQVHITLSDDGAGIDPERVAARALEAGLVTPEEVQAMSSGEKVNLVTRPGLSTAEQVNDLSGRGVGMDVVSTNLAKVGGHLHIDTRPGEGTTMLLRLPLTLAIIPSLIIGTGGQVFAIPQADVRELVRVRADQASERIEKVGDAPVLRLRERLLPLVRLSRLLGLASYYTDPASGGQQPDRRVRLADRRHGLDYDPEAPEPEPPRERRAGSERRRRFAGDINVVVLRLGANRYGLVVDELFDTEEIVVKPLARHLKESGCYSGTTIMGDGRVAMILDAAGMARQAGLRFSRIAAREARRRERARQERAAARRKTRSVVLFSCAANQYFAVPLASVAHLEKVAVQDIEPVAGGECIQYRGTGLPLLRLEKFLPVKAISSKATHLFVIIPRGPTPVAGIAAAQVVDILDTDVALRPYRGPVPGLAGIAPLRRRLTLFINMEELLATFVDQA